MLLLHAYSYAVVSQAAQRLAVGLLVLNLLLHTFVLLVAGWAINHRINETSASGIAVCCPVQLSPTSIYTMGSPTSTEFLPVFSLVAGALGGATSLAGLCGVSRWDVPNLSVTAAASVMAWSLDFLAASVACKEKNIGEMTARGRTTTLRTLQPLTIILSITQLLCTGTIYASLAFVSNFMLSFKGRVSLS